MDEQEYMTLSEASKYAGIKRATIYNYLNDLNIKTFKAGRSHQAYITTADAQKLKEYKASPWKFKVEMRKRKEDTLEMPAVKKEAA